MSMLSYKVMLLGTKGAGKTSIARRLKFNAFDANHKSTIGVELYSVNVGVDDGLRKVVLWDTDGEFGDRVFENVFVKGADAALVVADVSAKHSVEAMIRLCDAYEDHYPGTLVIPVLNKIDLTRPGDAELAPLQNSLPFLRLCSAKTGDGVAAAINHLVTLLAA